MFLLRHGQSTFNLHYNATRRDPGIEDPELTPLGLAQAAAAGRRLAGVPLTRIIVSPYTRALQTAQAVLAVHAATVLITHEVRERAYFVCDVGSPPEHLARRFPQHDFSHLPNPWWTSGIEAETVTIERAAAFRKTMAADPASATTLLVSHWAFILALTGRSLDNGELIEYDPVRIPHHIDWNS